jgi:hypothetical protein
MVRKSFHMIYKDKGKQLVEVRMVLAKVTEQDVTFTSNPTVSWNEHSRALALPINGHRPISSICLSCGGDRLPLRENKSKTTSINPNIALDMNG